MLPNLAVTVPATASLVSLNSSYQTTILVTGPLFSPLYQPPPLAMEPVGKFHRRQTTVT